YQDAGLIEDAIAIYEPLLTERQRILGGEHPHTLETRSTLANAYRQTGQRARDAPLR
ncbi:MAG: hypothetical protein QOD24_4116, partial [Solirubrobacteraceae bacterium]|nr:hypothetical protein [Solirubrobacteraceae bacterium]